MNAAQEHDRIKAQIKVSIEVYGYGVAETIARFQSNYPKFAQEIEDFVKDEISVGDVEDYVDPYSQFVEEECNECGQSQDCLITKSSLDKSS